MFLSPGSRARPLARQRDLLGYQISTSVTSGNNLIIVLTQVLGADPFIAFRDATLANGDPVYRAIPNGGQFIINSGNTMGAANGVPFHLWLLGFDNGGGVSLGAINCVVGGATPTQVFALDESSLQSPTGGNGGSTAATFFCAQGLTSRPFRILGYLEWSSGLATAGVWNTKPTKVQVFGAGIKKPGDPVQKVYKNVSTASSGITSTTPTATPVTNSITMNSAANLVAISWGSGGRTTNGTLTDCVGQLYRIGSGSTTAVGPLLAVGAPVSGNSDLVIGSPEILDAPGIAAPTYTVKANDQDNTTSIFLPFNSGTTPFASITLTEIMA